MSRFRYRIGCFSPSKTQLPFDFYFLEIRLIDSSHGLSIWKGRLGIAIFVSGKGRIPCLLNLHDGYLPHNFETTCMHTLVSLHNWSTYNHKSYDIIFQRLSAHSRSTSALVCDLLTFVFGSVKANALAVFLLKILLFDWYHRRRWRHSFLGVLYILGSWQGHRVGNLNLILNIIKTSL